jgi:hypothetical protein
MTAALKGWNRFWFEPESTSTMAVVRIAVGLLTAIWAISLAPDLGEFYMRDGIVGDPAAGRFAWGLLGSSRSSGAVWAVWGVLVVSALCLATGTFTRVAAAAAWIAYVSLLRRNPSVFNSGDVLLSLVIFYVMLMPSGNALSIDRWRRKRDDFWEFPERCPWALRLLQIQLVVVYLATVWIKARGVSWNDGTAVSNALRIADHTRITVPSWVTDSLLASNLLTYGTFAIEAVLGVFVWHRRTRPWVLGFGILLHLFIEATILIGFFTAAIFVAYLAWVPPETMRSWLLACRDRHWRWRAPTRGSYKGSIRR